MEWLNGFTYPYNFHQWLALFYIYAFFGWVYECLFVSVQKRKWVNRGFMVGPMLPLYGSGAVVMLFVALPFRENLFLVYIAGCIGATILEYITGVLMEKLFKVRYWDYSDKKFNFQGHIYLGATLLWGFFTVAMVWIVNPPIANLILQIDDGVLEGIVFVISMIAIADFTYSFKAALDLKALLLRLETSKKDMERLYQRLEDLITQSNENRTLHLEAITGQMGQRAKNGLSKLENYMESRLEAMRQQLEELKKLEYRGGLTRNEATRKFWDELDEIKERLAVFYEKRKNVQKQYSFGIRNLLKGNPDAVTKEDVSLLEELRNMLESEKKKKNHGK